jgi:hypothetical protein
LLYIGNGKGEKNEWDYYNRRTNGNVFSRY